MWRSFLAMGDSVTEGVGDHVPGFRFRPWPDLVADALRGETPGLVFRNVAHKGATADEVWARQVPVLRRMRPELVTLTIGGNDARRPEWTAEDFEQQLTQIVAAQLEVGARPMLFAYPDILPTVRHAGHEIRESWRLYFDRMHAVNDVIRNVAARNGTMLLDLECLEAARDPRMLSRDFTHPNALGYRLTARETLGVLARELARPELAEMIAPVS